MNNPPSGVYWINPKNVTGGAFQVYCDMDDKYMYDDAVLFSKWFNCVDTLASSLG